MYENINMCDYLMRKGLGKDSMDYIRVAREEKMIILKGEFTQIAKRHIFPLFIGSVSHTDCVFS